MGESGEMEGGEKLMLMNEIDKEFKIEAIRWASEIHCAYVAANKDVKPEDAVELSKKIYAFLTDK